MKKIFNNKARIGLSVICKTALVMVILILINLLTALIPQNITLLDTSKNKMYSISDDTKRTISSIDEKIEIYLLTDTDEKSLDDTGIHLNAFLKRFAALNPNINYTLLNVSSTNEYLESKEISLSDISTNSILVEGKSRYRYIDNSEIFYYYIDGIGNVTSNEAQIYQLYYGLSPVYKFEGENLLLSSLNYVTATDLPLAINLTGHGETTLSNNLISQFTTAGIEVTNLESVSFIPNSEMLIINNPTSDIEENEASLISQYLDNGGKLFLVTAPGTSDFTNLRSILKNYGLDYEDGIILDQTQGNYYQYPYYLIPNTQSHISTEALTTSVLLPFAHGINVSEIDGTVNTEFLYTSESSYIIPTTSSTISKPEGQDEKKYTVGVISEKNDTNSTLVWVSSQMFFDESVNSAASDGNFEYIISISNYLCDNKNLNNVNVSSLTLTTEKLTFSYNSMAFSAILIIGIIPISVIIIGLIYCHKRKAK